MKRAALYVALFFAFLFPIYVLASVATVSWSPPVTNTDGSTIPLTGAGSITETRVQYGTCASGGGFGTASGQVIVAMPATSVEINSFSSGQTVCFRAFARNSFGIESAASNVASKTFDPPKPRPPVLMVVDTVAYEIRLDRDLNARLGRDVGRVAAGTECSGTAMVVTRRAAYYVIDNASVSFNKEPRSSVIVARCAWS
jgi:hypothetical protein